MKSTLPTAMLVIGLALISLVCASFLVYQGQMTAARRAFAEEVSVIENSHGAVLETSAEYERSGEAYVKKMDRILFRVTPQYAYQDRQEWLVEMEYLPVFPFPPIEPAPSRISGYAH